MKRGKKLNQAISNYHENTNEYKVLTQKRYACNGELLGQTNTKRIKKIFCFSPNSVHIHMQIQTHTHTEQQAVSTAPCTLTVQGRKLVNTQGTIMQHLPTHLSSHTYTILPTTPKHLQFKYLKRNPHFQGVFPCRILYILLLSEYTKVSVVQRPPARTAGCHKREKTQIFHRSTEEDQNDFPVLATTSMCSNKWFCSVITS